MACVELLTYKVHLIPLPKLATIHFVTALEILQSMRGRMNTIILDDASSHLPLDQSTDPSPHAKIRKSILQGLLEKGHASTLANLGIEVVISISKRHEKF